MLNYNECVDYIHNFFKFNKKAGLIGITKLLEELGNPQDKLKFIHIAGTNGKGSTAAMCSNILKNAGYKVGLFISPFVIKFNERFQVDNQFITDDELCKIVNILHPIVDKLLKQNIPIAQFEMVTAIGMLHFFNNKCDIVCLEVGIGGLFDATNVIKTSVVNVITSISMDHTKVLGDSIKEIAYNKAGIIKDNSNVVMYPIQEDDAIATVMEQCAKTNSKFYMPNIGHVKIIQSDINNNIFTYSDIEIITSLAGKHQIYNAITVIEIIRLLNSKGFDIKQDNIIYGIKNTYFPARMQKIMENPIVIVDGAHNIDGIKVLSENIKNYNQFDKKIFIIGTLKDKDYEKSLPCLAQNANKIFTVNINSERCLSSEELYDFLIQYNKNTFIFDNVFTAYKQALKEASKDTLILICGSLYLASEFLLGE